MKGVTVETLGRTIILQFGGNVQRLCFGQRIKDFSVGIKGNVVEVYFGYNRNPPWSGRFSIAIDDIGVRVNPATLDCDLFP